MMKNKEICRKIMAAACAAAMTVGAAAVPAADAANASTDDYAKLLQYSLYFYDANMCGDQVSETTRLTWRSDCHTSDQVKGGFHDAGDHVKFGLPAGFAASTLGWSYYEFSNAYNSTGQTAHLQTITDYFAKFFKDSTTLSGNTVTNFVYQIGDGDADHAEWCAPELQGSSSRKVYSTSGGASDIAAEYAAALAVNYINFGNSEDLMYAEALYKFSTQYNQIATEGTSGFYNSSSLNDDQAWAAGWLYLATGNSSYKSDCANKQGYVGWAHSWDSVTLGAACVYAHITNDWSSVNNYLRGQCRSDSYYFLDEWGSARYNASMQMCALVASKNSSADYLSWSKGQMSYLLGNNPANTCFVVGLGDNSAKYPHHRGASGYNSYGEFEGRTTYSSSGHTLTGALVGGPTNASGSYVDSVQDYQANEVALDYNAGLVGAAAGLYEFTGSGSTVDPSSIPEVKSGTTDPEPSGERVTITTTQSSGSGSGSTTTTSVVSSEPGEYTMNLGQDYTNGSADNFPGWPWYEFGIPNGDTVTKVEITISAKSGNLNQWQGAFGTNTKSGDYWYQSETMSKSFGTSSGVITWEIPSDVGQIINYDSGELRFGIWYVDPSQITIDSIKVYTDGASAALTTTTSPTTTTTTAKPTTTTTKATTTTTKTTTTTTKATTTTTKATTTTTKATTTTTKPTTTTTKATTTTTKPTTTTTKATTTTTKTTTTTTKATTTTTKATTTTTKPTTTTTKSTTTTTKPTTTTTKATTTTTKPTTTTTKATTTTTKATTTTTKATTTTTKATTTTTKATTTTTKATTTTTKATTTTTKATTTTTKASTTTTTAPVKGDVNGDGKVSVADLVKMSRYLLGAENLSKTQAESADMNGDGRVNAFDLVLLRRKLMNK